MKLFKGHHVTKAPAQLQREIDEALAQPSEHAAIRDPSFRLLYLAAGRRTMSPEEFSTVEDATRAVNFLKRRGFRAWVEDATGKFVPVKGVLRKPPSVD